MSGAALSRARLNRMHDVMAGYVERGQVPGMVALVHRRDETHVEELGTAGFGNERPMRRDAIFRIASLTKPIVAVAAMILVEECRLRLDDPVDPWLPELANRRVLVRPDGLLDDTVPAKRPITLRDLLTLRLGMGFVFMPDEPPPIQQAMSEAGLSPGPIPQDISPDEWLRRLGDLPLVHQPGEGWMYDTGFDVLGILIARAAGEHLEDFLRQRIFEPLGMRDTAFHVPASALDRLPPSYISGPEPGALALHDDPRTGRWARPPAFPSGAGGLVSTVDDYLAFSRILLDKGRFGSERILSRPAVELMTIDHLTPEQKASRFSVLDPGQGWGFGVGIDTTRRTLASTPGRFGWVGGLGTSAYTDPTEGLIGILMTQCAYDTAFPDLERDFWTSVYQAIDD